MQANNISELGSSYTGAYSTGLLLMSVMVVGVVAFVAFHIAIRIQQAKLASVRFWLSWWLMGSIFLGLSIWSAHFICMLAFEPPVPVSFGLQLTLLSTLPAVLISALLLRINLGFKPGQAYQWVIATTIGAGFVLMHFMAVQAMRMEALLIYDAKWLSGFVLLCIVFSFMANAIKFKLQCTARESGPGIRLLLTLSLLIAILIVSVNLVATRAVQFYPVSGLENSAVVQLISPQLLFSVAMATVAGILVLLLASVQFGYRMDSTALLRDYKAFNKSMLDHSMEAIISADNDGRIHGFNKAAETMFGYKAADILGKKFPLLLSDHWRKLAEFRLAGGVLDASRYFDQEYEVTACRINGSEFTASVQIGQVNNHGKLGMVAFVRDISALRKAETERFRNQQRLEMLLCASPMVIYTRSIKGSIPITYVSPGCSVTFGFDPDEITRSPSFWSNQVHPEDRHELEDMRKLLRNEGKSHCEYRLKFADGSFRWISDAQTLVFDEHGEPSMVVGYWTDVHDKKTTQLELELTEERLRVGFECNGMSSWDWIMQSGELRFSSDSAALLGIPETTPFSMDDLVNTVHSEDRAILKKAFRQALVSGDPLDQEYRVVWPDRSIHWIRTVGSFVNNPQGNPVRMIGVMTEVTDQKQLRVASARIA